jgi:hypothetical protein
LIYPRPAALAKLLEHLITDSEIASSNPGTASQGIMLLRKKCLDQLQIFILSKDPLPHLATLPLSLYRSTPFLSSDQLVSSTKLDILAFFKSFVNTFSFNIDCE